jgi:hypothetical protein
VVIPIETLSYIKSSPKMRIKRRAVAPKRPLVGEFGKVREIIIGDRPCAVAYGTELTVKQSVVSK